MSPTSKLLLGKFSVRTATCTASPSVSSTGPSSDVIQCTAETLRSASIFAFSVDENGAVLLLLLARQRHVQVR